MRSFCKRWGLINTVYVCQELVYYSDPFLRLKHSLFLLRVEHIHAAIVNKVAATVYS